MKVGNFLWNYKKSFRLEGRSVPFQMLDLGASHSSVPKMLFGCSVLSDTLRTYGLQHGRLPCPSPSPRVCSNLCPLSRWWYPTISSSAIPFSPCLQSFSASGSFLMSQLFESRWPKYWSFNFNISPSSEHPGLISFRMDWLDLLAIPRDSQESSPTPQFKSINSSAISIFYSSTLTSIHDHWKNHCLN